MPDHRAALDAPFAHQNDDEINLADLARKIWATRKVWLASMVLVTVGFVTFWAYKHLADPVRYTYSKPIQLVFKGVDAGQYPNGSNFRMADVIAPSVLHQVYQDNRLEEFDLSQETFQRAFTVSPYAADEAFILAKHSGVLDNKKASAQEIEAAQAALKQELNQARNRALQIRFSPVGIALPDTVITKVLEDVARVWAEKAIQERGVLELDISLNTHRLFSAEQLAALDYPIAVILLRERAQMLERNIRNVQSLPNALSARDHESQVSLNDVDQKLEEIRNYELDMLEALVLQRMVYRDLDTTVLYLKERMKKLIERKDSNERKAQAIRQSLQDYIARYQINESPSNNAGASNNNGTAMVPQIGDKFMDRLVSMVQEGSDLKYRQALNDRATEFELDVIALDTDIQRLQRQIDNLTGKGDKTPSTEHTPRIERLMLSIFDRLKEHALTVERIYAQLGRENLSSDGRLYLALGEGYQTQGSRLFVDRQFKLAYLLALVLVSMLVIPSTMLRNSLRGKHAE
jgi:tetratricopeptide (TPR) repeat protein